MGIIQRFRSRRSLEFWRAGQKALHRMGAVGPPEAVQWISTSACDLRCPHCYSEAGRKAPNELSTDEAKSRLIDELVRMDRPTLVIAGGESLLRPDLRELIGYAHAQRVPWAMHTHGGHVLKNLSMFREFPPVMVAVSLDGPAEFHDTFRGRKGSHAAALAAMGKLKEVGVPEVVAGTTVHRGNAELLADMVPDVFGSGADSWGLHLMTPEGRARHHPELLPTAVQLRRVASFGRRMREVFRVELDNEWGAAGRDDCFYRETPFTCGAGRISCVVAANGDLLPCTTTDSKESEGNIRSQSLSTLWAEKFVAFRSEGDPVKSDTTDCWLQTRSGCSCRWSAFSMDLLALDAAAVSSSANQIAAEGIAV